MAQISYSSQALTDLERIVDFLAGDGEPAQAEVLGLIEEAINLLARHPLIGRPAESALRELIISQGRTGYVALYSYEAAHDAILVLGIRHQREAGFYGPPR